jgi:hypothetical protein
MLYTYFKPKWRRWRIEPGREAWSLALGARTLHLTLDQCRGDVGFYLWEGDQLTSKMKVSLEERKSHSLREIFLTAEAHPKEAWSYWESVVKQNDIFGEIEETVYGTHELV